MIKLIASFTLLFLISVSMIDETNATICSRRSLIGQLENFNCPNNILEVKAQYCCGTESNRFCCKKSKAREHNFRNANYDGLGKSVAKGVGITLIIILIVVCGCIGLCCYCICNMFRSKTSSGSVLGGVGGGGQELAGQSVHVVNQPSAGGQYPAQPSYPSYPTGQPAGYPSYPTGQPGGYPAYQQAPPPNMYPTASYPMAQSSAPPPYPMEQQPPYNPNYPG